MHDMRKFYLSRYGILYDSLKLYRDSDRNKCYYCGLPASTIDHQPPVSKIESMISCGDPFEAVKVPCCHECNCILGDRSTVSLSERFLFLKDKLREKYMKDMKISATWTYEEISEMGRSLQGMILASIGVGIEAEERILYKGHRVVVVDDFWSDPSEMKWCEKCGAYYSFTCPTCDDSK